MGQDKGDQKAPDSAVTVQERVDRLELRMRQACPDERRQVGFGVKERLQFVQAPVHLLDRWRDEACRLRIGAADPILRATELTRCLRGFTSTDPGHEPLMDLADEPE